MCLRELGVLNRHIMLSWKAMQHRYVAFNGRTRSDKKGGQTYWIGPQPGDCGKERQGFVLILVIWTFIWKIEHYEISLLERQTCVYCCWSQRSFWKVPLIEESMLFTKFSTPFGRYCFTRMPFGICSASEILRKRAYQTFWGIADVRIIADDMILASENEKDHDQLITTV